MKRSKSLSLALISASAIALSACDNSQEIAVFQTPDECASQGGIGLEQCQQNFLEAKEEHIRVAPKYTTVADCEVDFGEGKCEIAPQQTSSGGSVFMPLMMGYMMGNLLGGNSSFRSQPLYRSKDDPSTFRTGDNQTVARNTGITTAPKSVTQPASTKTTTVRRGGFGTTATRMSSTSPTRSYSYGG